VSTSLRSLSIQFHLARQWFLSSSRFGMLSKAAWTPHKDNVAPPTKRSKEGASSSHHSKQTHDCCRDYSLHPTACRSKRRPQKQLWKPRLSLLYKSFWLAIVVLFSLLLLIRRVVFVNEAGYHGQAVSATKRNGTWNPSSIYFWKLKKLPFSVKTLPYLQPALGKLP
jgi:hypothetical protein